MAQIVNELRQSEIKQQKQLIKLGVVCLARTTFDHLAGKELYDATKERLQQLPNIDWEFVEDLVIEVEDAEKAAKHLSSKGVDGLVIISGTFHLGHLALVLDKYVKKPILLWAFDELPYNGGKIRLNSVCGLNLNSSNLFKAGNDQYHVVIGDDIDENWVDAIRIKVALEHTKLGLAGYRAHGFFNLGIDELRTFSEIGVLVDHFELSEMWNEVPSDELVAEKESEVRRIFDCSEVSEEQVHKVARLIATSKAFMDKHGLTGVGIRCWPEFAATYGISPCAAMSILQSQGYVMGCEGDLEGTLTMIACRAVGAETPFLADLSQVNLQDNYALMWHCGVAPCNLWDGQSVRSLDSYFAGGRGVTADFVLKSGPVNMFRIDSARGKTRLFLTAGTAVPMTKDLKGTYAKVIFENKLKDVLTTVTSTGIAHHVSMVYGEFREPFRILGRLMKWEIIE